jgi:hypothetical protein
MKLILVLVTITLLFSSCTKEVEYSPKITPVPTLHYFKVNKLEFKPLEIQYEIS